MQQVAFYLKLILLFGIYLPSDEKQCLLKSVATPKRFFVDGKELPITVGHSKRTTHQLVSNILKILLNDVLGYSNVQLVRYDGLSDESSLMSLQKITRCSTPKTCTKTSEKSPEVMINLEVWLELEFNLNTWLLKTEVSDCGPLGPIGRSGWFVPTYSVTQILRTTGITLDHWRAFRVLHLSSLFDLFDGDNVLTSFTFDIHSNRTYCGTDKHCDEDGLFRPPQCQRKGIRCATLLVDYPESTLFALKRKVSDLGLLINIAWVGENLYDIVHNRIQERKPVLFFHKKPSLLLNLGNFTSISFKQCDDSFTACEFEIYKINKIAWSKVKENAPFIFHLLQSLSFTDKSYAHISKDYFEKRMRGSTIRDVACDWVVAHSSVWSEWLPSTLGDATTLYIGGIFPLTGTYWRQSAVVPAAQMAIEAVNRNASLLPNHRLTLLIQDGQCVVDEVMRSFIHYVFNSTFKSMVGILGPACTDTVEPIAGVAKHFNTIIVSYSAEGSLFDNREKYPYFFRTVPDNNQFLFVYLKLFQQLNWNRVASISEVAQEYSEYIAHLQVLLQSHGISFVSNNRFPRELNTVHIRAYLQELKEQNVRIIIGDFYGYAARVVMCAAYNMGMTASQGYQWFLPIWFTADWFDTDAMNHGSVQENIPCTTRQMKEAINGHLSLAYRPYAPLGDIMQENTTVGEWLDSYHERVAKENEQMSQYGGYAYDAVWAYATALHILFNESSSHEATLHTRKTSRRLAELLDLTRFSGVSGPLQFIGSSRLSEVVIWQWMKDTERRTVGIYHPFSKNNGELTLNASQITWMTSNLGQPGDGSKIDEKCPLQVFNDVLEVSCEVVMGVVLVTLTSIFLSFITFAVMFFKRRYEKGIRLTEARMKELGLTVNSRTLALDEWELPRDQVVINRKLGQGAFGTVYGGEAFVNVGWIAVAVKTLKIGAKPEEKLEFLSEAGLMKRLNHPNIIELIGVCTTIEPIYLVMEFMLYGDLKTYLLERRNLVTYPNRASNCYISNRQLTGMALDVARGLRYLAELKFVHRDLACRNCLVNSAYTVKIADFGLCRTIYESDYYRIRRKGLLPIRWMAPESIMDGVYTAMSDVWSFGVVLFEIITFGSFPYQCLTDREVIEHVSSCEIFNLPNGCKPELERLLKRCWSVLPIQRPLPSEIVKILENTPDLIWPCIDEPKASVDVEWTNSLSLPINVSSFWRRPSRKLSAIFSGELPDAHFHGRHAANNCIKEDGKTGMELKSAVIDISQGSYMYMGPPKSLSKNASLHKLSSSNLSQVTRL